ncbi:MAG: RNA polymerase sigma factor [Candidatus Krumholzibacteriota bacterium]|nr:RNA polymerase sigma factor [Candidatus Krumholzibacteriota bacterium]
MPGETDHELITRSLQGSQKAFRDLLERHHATAWAVVRGVLGDRDEVEDVIQQVYVKVFRGLARFRGDARFSTWLYQIARNEAINAVKKRRMDTTSIDNVVLVAPEKESPDAVMQRSRAGSELEAAMSRIDEKYRLAIELRYMGEHSYEEIAEIMDLPLGTVKTYIHRGKAELKKTMTRTLRRSEKSG